MAQTTMVEFSGTVIYFMADDQQERAATLNATYELQGNMLQGKLRFRGHKTWEADLDFSEPISCLPESWELKAGIRKFMRQYLERNSCTYRSMSLS